jgi:hypothetical protein
LLGAPWGKPRGNTGVLDDRVMLATGYGAARQPVTPTGFDEITSLEVGQLSKAK